MIKHNHEHINDNNDNDNNDNNNTQYIKTVYFLTISQKIYLSIILTTISQNSKYIILSRKYTIHS